MKRKLSISGILGILLVFGVFFTGCPNINTINVDKEENNGIIGGSETGGGGTGGSETGGSETSGGGTDGSGTDGSGTDGGGTDGSETGNGESSDSDGEIGDNEISGNETGTGNINNNTLKEGAYIGIMSFAGNVNELTGKVPVYLDPAGKTSLLNQLDSSYKISPQVGTALFYAEHKALANSSSMTQFPPDLSSINIINFSDGLDTGSTGFSALTPIEGKTFESETNYLSYLREQIATRLIAGRPITAYSVGVKGNDVVDSAKFESDLAQIASPEKSYMLADFSAVQPIFQEIADSLQVTRSNTTFTVKTPLLQSGTKVRMTFDVPGNREDLMLSSSCEGSTKYIEGTITRTGTGENMVYTLGDIKYARINSEQGSGPITGTRNGSEVDFAFTNLTGDYDPYTDLALVKQWLIKDPGEKVWSINSEYYVDGAINISSLKRSTIIWLILDSSQSLNETQIGQIRSSAKDFINSLYDWWYTAPNAPASLRASASSSSSISLSWDKVPNASFYKIYRASSIDGPYSFLTLTLENSYINRYLSPNTVYYYKVSAATNSAEGGQSSHATAMTIPSTSSGDGGGSLEESDTDLP
jgi:HSP20 family molecular chaperone IbpA